MAQQAFKLLRRQVEGLSEQGNHLRLLRGLDDRNLGTLKLLHCGIVSSQTSYACDVYGQYARYVEHCA